jgi:type IV pilus assembly protein PilN
LLLILSYNVYELAITVGEGRRLRDELAGIALKGKSALPPVSDTDWKNFQTDVASANAIILRKSFNWFTFLDSMEAVLPDGVTVTSFEPKAATGELKLSGLTLTFNGISMLLSNMETSGRFSDVFLLTQTEQKFGKTQKGIAFTITCKVKP